MLTDAPGYYLYDDGGEFAARCAMLCRAVGFREVTKPEAALFSLAPCWKKKIPATELAAPIYGVLVFHPSALPYGRGPDAIRWAVQRGERVSAATWFWADAGLDTGPICEQELVLLASDESPGRAYHTRFIPAGVWALSRALAGIAAGTPRRACQDHRMATYDGLCRPALASVGARSGSGGPPADRALPFG
jgi:methionyl-tRNA formyltransferase